MAGLRIGVAVPAFILAVGLGVLRAQDPEAADRAFREGVKAINDKNWPAAISFLQSAMKVAPSESPRKVGERFGMVGGIEYLPQFFLGKAYMGQKDCTNALDAWGRSEQAGVIAKVDPKYLRELQAGSKECEGRGFLPNAKLEAAAAAVTKQLLTANATADDVAGRARTQSDLFTADRRNRLSQVREEIKQAESRLDAGRRSRASAELNQAQAAATRATILVVALRSEFAKAETDKSTVQGLLAELERTIEQGRGLDGSIEGKRAFLNDTLGSTRQKGQQVLTAARRVADSSRAAGAEASDATLREAISTTVAVNGQLQEVLDELVAIESKANQTKNAAALRQTRDRFRLADQAIGTLDKRLKANPRPEVEAERQAIAQRLRAARRELESASTSGAIETIEETGRLADRERSRLVELTSGFGPLTLEERGVNTLLVQATRLFLNGDYAQVLTVLQPAEPFPPDMLFLEHVHLLRAAASFTQYLRAGRTDTALTDAARVEIVALKALNPAFQPDSRAFSPRFVEFFRSVPAPAIPPAEPAATAGAP